MKISPIRTMQGVCRTKARYKTAYSKADYNGIADASLTDSVEKANGLTVAKRQKRQGMSWSYRGSWHFAALTALYLNQEADVWHKTGSLSFKMTPVSIHKSETSAPAAA